MLNQLKDKHKTHFQALFSLGNYLISLPLDEVHKSIAQELNIIHP
jgi:hypothetical protein